MDKTKIDLGALIIALIALVQPWIIYLWKRFIKPGSVEFFQTGTIEIGFSDYASTIGINGTLRAMDKDFYISGISVELIKEKDSSRHFFDWAVFRDTKISLSGKNDMDVELPYGILITTQSPERINIQFHDRKQQEEINPIYNNLSSHWLDFLKKKNPRNIIDSDYNTNEAFDEFSKDIVMTNSYTNINREFYWDKGNYSLTLKVLTSKPNKVFINNFKFSLTEDECKMLRYNIITLTDLACEQNRSNWNFIYVNYK